MKYFLSFLILCFMGGLLLGKTSPRVRGWLLMGACLALCVLYFVFDKL